MSYFKEFRDPGISNFDLYKKKEDYEENLGKIHEIKDDDSIIIKANGQISKIGILAKAWEKIKGRLFSLVDQTQPEVRKFRALQFIEHGKTNHWLDTEKADTFAKKIFPDQIPSSSHNYLNQHPYLQFFKPKYTFLQTHPDSKSATEQSIIAMQEKENEYPEKFPESPLAEKTFGFKAVSGFDLRERGDGYITADNQGFDPASDIRITKSEVNSGLKRGNKIIPEKQLELLRKEYKIHLMPKPEAMAEVVKRLQDKLANNSFLKSKIAQYKVLIGEEENGEIRLIEKKDRHGQLVPSIAIYAESKDAAQIILDTLCELFPDSETLGVGSVPRNNQSIDKLIHYAQGSADIKSLMADELFDENKIHFKGDENKLDNPRTKDAARHRNSEMPQNPPSLEIF